MLVRVTAFSKPFTEHLSHKSEHSRYTMICTYINYFYECTHSPINEPLVI